jgi:hypothetical protein
MVMAKTSKSPDEARANYKAKKGLPKGGGKGAKGYKLYTPVKQSTIDNIKKMGMSAALKKAGSSKNAEFVQGVKRMYGVKRLEASMASAKKSAPAKSPDAARAKYAAKNAKRNQPAAKSADEARSKYIGTGSNKAQVTPLNKMKPKASGGGLFPGLLTGNYKGKKITRGKASGPGYFKS